MSRDKIRILYVIVSLSPGGAENLLISTLKYLNKDKFIPYVCCTKNEGSLAYQIKEIGIEVFPIRMKSMLDFKALRKIYQIVKDKKISIIHSNFVDIDIICRILSLLSGTKCISSIHSAFVSKEYERLKWKTLFFISRITVNLLPVLLIANSKYVKQIHVDKFKYSSKRIITIYNFCNEESLKIPKDFYPTQKRQQLGLNDENIIFIHVGRLVKDKCQEQLIEIIKKAYQRNRKIRLLIVGTGPMEKQLKKIVLELGLNEIIQVLGYREDLPELLGMSDFFILSSKKEGIPIALLEAMYFAKPIISTNVGGISEAIIDNESGILINRDEIDTMPDRILEIAQDKDRSQKLGIKAKMIYLERFSVEKYITRLENVYQEVLERDSE